MRGKTGYEEPSGRCGWRAVAGREWQGLRWASRVGLMLERSQERGMATVPATPVLGGAPRAGVESHAGFMQPDADPVAAC